MVGHRSKENIKALDNSEMFLFEYFLYIKKDKTEMLISPYWESPLKT